MLPGGRTGGCLGDRQVAFGGDGSAVKGPELTPEALWRQNEQGWEVPKPRLASAENRAGPARGGVRDTHGRSRTPTPALGGAEEQDLLSPVRGRQSPAGSGTRTAGLPLG